MTGGPDEENQRQMGRGLHYTCRHDGNDIIVTTEKSVAESSGNTKSRAFIAKNEYTPIDITDYAPKKNKQKDSLEYLEDVLVKKLFQETADWPIGTERTLDVKAEPQNYLPVNEREIEFARIKTQPKKAIYERSVFTAMTRSKAIVGEPVNLHFGIQGKVVDVRESEVEVVFEPKSDKPLEGPFGPVLVHDKGDRFQTEIDIQKGNLVRMGGIVGEISEVGERTFRIDYSHPFGGRSLTCDVAIKALEQSNKPLMKAKRVDANANKATVLATSVSSAVAEPSTVENNHSKLVEAGDLVTVAYTATLESGELLHTTHASVATNPNQKKIDNFWQDTFGPETLMAGSQEEFPGLGYAVRGLKIGEQQRVVVPPEEAFGARELQRLAHYDRERIIQTSIRMSAKQYTQRFGGFPIKDKTVTYNSYVNARIVDVTEKGAVMKLVPVKEEIDDVFGTTRMEVIGDTIHMHLTPKMGANFELDKRKGRVVAVDSQKFTVDFNDPLAGQNIVYDIEVLEITKASVLSDIDIEWIEDHETGLEMARKQNKPVVLLLYAEWCSYCKKLAETTLTDPRIESMRDDFVWIKVDSDKQYPELKTLYKQTSFPLTVLLNSNGEKVGSISGYRPANDFRSELMKAFRSTDTKSVLSLKAEK
jgi:FKBP-type peptidyl-prolyl cis-trans isomerase 2